MWSVAPESAIRTDLEGLEATEEDATWEEYPIQESREDGT
jgi:hypothetical protein